ncbi:MAG: aldo/keto reductase [Gammaproteobacteria bacterium]|nr:aldo/keto reductase [Gammaproteobacteria bacterium]
MATAAGLLALPGGWLRAATAGAAAIDDGLISRAIPQTGERLPVMGLGSSATFARAASAEDVGALREVLSILVAQGGRVVDTAPAYGAAEETAGRIAQQLGIAQQLFWATKLNVAVGGKANPAKARQQLEASFSRIGRPVIDLVQVHNTGDIATQLPILRELKEAGRVRYIGVTATFPDHYGALLEAMRKEPLDFIGTDYAVDNRAAEQRFLPLAQERGIAVMVYAPFGRTRLWKRVAGRELPAWAADFGATSWAQFFLKFVASHPAVTVITPATSRPDNMRDNMMAIRGALPDAKQRRRMIDLIEALPAA